MSRAKINELLSERHRRFSPLQRLLHRASAQQSWTAQLRALLPEPLCRDCVVTEINGPVVVILCSNAASATRLRFMAQDLLSELTQLGDFRTAQEIHIRVAGH
ncbi:MAG: DciA family protein [Pseudomonadales bacterium]